jgi:two-component system cell cycle sensor histidine kinase/response regulator CckA
MEDERKTKKQLIEELTELRQRVAQLDGFEEEIKQTRINQEKFTKAFLQSSIPMTITTVKEGRFVDVSDAFLRLVGRKRDEVIGHTSRETGFVTDEQRAFFYNQLSKSGRVEDLEMEVSPKGKGLRYGLFNIVMMSYSNENFLLTTIQDITDRKLAEQALRESEEQLRSLSENTADGMVYQINSGLDGQTRLFSYLSPTIEKLHGLKVEDVKRDPSLIYNQIDEKYRALIEKVEAHAYATMSKLDIDLPIHLPSGDVRWRNFTSSPRTQSDGSIIWDGIELDIHDRKQAETALRESEDNFRRSLDESPLGVRIVNVESETIYANRTILDIYGYDSIEELKTTPVEKCYTKESYAEFQIRREKIKRGVDVPSEYTVAIMRKNGEVRHLQVYRKEILWNGERKYQIIYQDITERKQSEEKFRLITENMMDCVALVDTNGIYQYVTPSYRGILGYETEDMIGTSGFSLIHPDDLEKITRLYMEGIEQGLREASSELMIRHKDGHYLTMEVKAGALNDPQGKLIGGILTARDITERKRMEEELMRAHKLESLGTLAGGIAHDFNNLMTVVQGYIGLALMDLPSNHASRQNLLTAMRSVDQTKDLTSRLITFSRGGGPLKEAFDVSEILRDAVHRTVKETNVKVTFDLKENLWPVVADELQMKQCFYNLTTNAMEAMPDGGNLTISAENALMPAGELPDMQEGSYLKITFTDEGIGIHEERLAKIFDPYFTTKKMGARKGLGLGLAVCYSVLKNHDGHITVKSTPGEGASFTLYLPARPEPVKEKEAKKTSSTGAVRVLIMDDEPQIREIERAYLELMGHEVTDVRDGQEAIDTYQQALESGNPFDLVLLDLTVRKGMGGKLAMERLLTINPSIKAIIASGFADDPVIENYADYRFPGGTEETFQAGRNENISGKDT